MTSLPRLKPQPIPAIHPLPEYRVEGERKDWYEDMKQVLQVPWMGVVTMAFAHYPAFFKALWQGTRTLCASRPFVAACHDNRLFAETEIAKLNPPPLSERLGAQGYAPRETAEIRHCLEIFHCGNQPYVLLASLARYLMEAGDMAGSQEPQAAALFEGSHGPETNAPLVLMEEHHADAPTRAIYDDVRQVLGLPFVNTDYRALARWPSYWSLAWGDLKGVAASPAHEALCQAFHERCLEQVSRQLPNPGDITAAGLREAAARDAPVEEVRDVCRLFQWLLPGLVINVAYLRAQLTVADGN